MWGQVRSIYLRSVRERIIPTRVGTSRLQKPHLRQGMDHPHACGDKGHRSGRRCKHGGSSPRVWGQVSGVIVDSVRNRIIPTRVGTRLFCQALRCTRQNHPHACGDKTICTAYPSKSRGSSPRVWGQDTSACDRGFFAGIIPTRVGTRGI